MLPSGVQHDIAHGDQQATIVELGAALRRYAAGGVEMLDGFAADEQITAGRGQTLAPWPNRIRDGRYAFDGQSHQLALTEPGTQNAIHGLVRWVPFVAAERTPSSVVMRQTLFPQAGWPFTLVIDVAYALSDGGLSVTTSARNAGTGPCPFGSGHHPYLTVGTERVDDAILRSPQTQRLVDDSRQIPIGRGPVAGTEHDFRTPRAIGDVKLDDAYSALERDEDGLARVELAAPSGRRVELWLGEGYPYLMLFTGDSVPQPERRRRALGVEPMTCAPNALQTGDGLQILDPGETFSATWGVRLLVP